MPAVFNGFGEITEERRHLLGRFEVLLGRIPLDSSGIIERSPFVDANPDLPGKFGIRGIPTLIVFKGGSAVETKVGALSKTQLAEFVDGCL